MLLKSLEIQGFKTFPDKTKLEFDKGITAVVGPNGSGKSNISDAIRWVLGEQSAKALRCSKMEDVVFNGTDNRKKVGYAEVTLTIDNRDRTLAFDGDSVAVTRRYYRSGDSDYLINKVSVRLKDIHELFMDTGLGRDGYSMISQGKIDSIVASKSEDRREIFEEASGISRYRYRKSEAERKLAQTEENLLRLRDILTELEERVGPLEKQAEKAKAYLVYAKKKEGLEIALWLNTIEKSGSQLREQEDKITVAKAQHEAAVKALEDISRETDDIYASTGEFASKMDDIRRINAEIENVISEIRAKISVEENNIAHLLDSIERMKGEIAAIDSESERMERELDEKKRKHSDLIAQRETENRAFGQKSLELSELMRDDGKGELLTQYNSKLSSLNVRIAGKKAAKISADESARELSESISASDESIKARQTQLDKQRTELAEFTDEIVRANDRITVLTNTVSGQQLILDNNVKKRDRIKTEGEQLALDRSEALRHKNLLEDLERNLEGFNQSVKLVVKEARRGVLQGIHGPVSRVIKTPPEYAVAIETALGAAMQNIVTSTEEDAKKAIALLKKRDGGRATFLPLSTVKGRDLDESGLESNDGFIGIASRLCECEKKYEGVLRSLLGRICITDDLDHAVKIAGKYGYRFRIVTLDGQVVNAGGSLTGGSLGKKTGLLSRVSEIEKLAGTVAELDEKLAERRKLFTAAQADCGKAEAQLGESRRELAEASEDKLRAETACRSCEEQIKLLTDSLNEQINNRAALISQRSAAEERSAEAEKDINIAEKEIAALQSSADDISDEIAKQTEQRAKITEELQNIKLAMLGLDKDIQALELEIANASAAGGANREKRAKTEALIKDEESKKAQIENIIIKLNSDKSVKRREVAANNERIAALSAERAKLEKRTAELRRLERDKSDEKEKIGGELARLEERKANLQKQYNDIIQKLWDEYELTPKTAKQNAADIESVTAAQKQLAQLKSKIKALGSVNVAAIDEYKEVSERYEFMKAQVGDVERSKKEITSLIGDLTKQMKEIFVERFALINKNFGETFKQLFGGGEASLSLTNEDDILGSGIEINCHPPGKIVSHLESLSGGERALVAIALYFAIMKVSPAPFCVMDEIEAALDEVNVDRFAQYMRTINDRTQFILITHRRGTMEEADVLYGVTMQDEGVSKLLELHSTEVAASFTRLK